MVISMTPVIMVNFSVWLNLKKALQKPIEIAAATWYTLHPLACCSFFFLSLSLVDVSTHQTHTLVYSALTKIRSLLNPMILIACIKQKFSLIESDRFWLINWPHPTGSNHSLALICNTTSWNVLGFDKPFND